MLLTEYYLPWLQGQCHPSKCGIFNNNIRAHVVNKTDHGFSYCLQQGGDLSLGDGGSISCKC